MADYFVYIAGDRQGTIRAVDTRSGEEYFVVAVYAAPCERCRGRMVHPDQPEGAQAVVVCEQCGEMRSLNAPSSFTSVANTHEHAHTREYR